MLPSSSMGVCKLCSQGEKGSQIQSGLKVTGGFGHVQGSYVGFTVLVQKGRMALDDICGPLAGTFTGAMSIKIKYEKKKESQTSM